MEREQGEEFARREIDPKTGVVEKVDREKRARELSENPGDRPEQP